MNSHRKVIGIGLLGLGVVGGGVLKAVNGKSMLLAEEIGLPVSVIKVLVRDLNKERDLEVTKSLLTTDPMEVISNPDVDVVIEVMGGEQPALDYISKAIQMGKSVITANKEVMAKHGHELLGMAMEKGVHLLFEASVGGGIPIIGPLTKDLAANNIEATRAIINGTTNYILTKMSYEDVEFGDALREAQALGYAEADPASDVEGTDAAYKLAILASLAFRTRVKDEDVYREGISSITAKDIRYADELGYAVKLMAIARRRGDSIEARVHPVLVPKDTPLGKVDGVFNAVEVECDMVGKVLFHGRGAGEFPTTSAIIGDLIEAGRAIVDGLSTSRPRYIEDSIKICPMSDLATRYYIRVTVADQAGVLAQLSKILGELQISIASVMQKESDPALQTAELVITTHISKEMDVQQAMKGLQELHLVKQIDNVLRVEE